MVNLTGEIFRETNKAILFKVEEDICLHLQGETLWFPKSNIRLPKRQKGKIRINVQHWLYESNIKIPDNNL